MNPIQRLEAHGQSVWLDDDFDGDLVASGRLRRYMDDLSVSGLTSQLAGRAGGRYHAELVRRGSGGEAAEDVLFSLVAHEVRAAADVFRPVYDACHGTKGWTSVGILPAADDADRTVHAAVALHARIGRPNVFVEIPGTTEGTQAAEELIFAGIPVNATLLFSPEHYRAAAGAYLRGIARRVCAGLDPSVPSVASLSVSPWDFAVNDRVPASLRNRLGITIAQSTYRAYLEQINSADWRSLAAAGARPQRLLWAGTGTMDPAAAETLYVEALVASDTISAIPDRTLRAFADHGVIRGLIPLEEGDSRNVLAHFADVGVDIEGLSVQLQREGVLASIRAWSSPLAAVSSRAVPPPPHSPGR